MRVRAGEQVAAGPRDTAKCAIKHREGWAGGDTEAAGGDGESEGDLLAPAIHSEVA